MSLKNDRRVAARHAKLWDADDESLPCQCAACSRVRNHEMLKHIKASEELREKLERQVQISPGFLRREIR